MARRKIILLGNFTKVGVREEIARLTPWFSQHADIVASLSMGQPLPPAAEKADLCVVFGGDGTLLSAVRMLAGTDVALLGVNMGKLGFLAEYNLEHLQKHLEEILSGKVSPTERLLLDVTVRDGATVRFESPVANDLAISAGSPFRMIDLHVSQEESEIAQYLGDGLVISTPTGSTGYNMSAGGPIMEPTLDAVAITPIAPHSLAMRPIVVRAERTIRITAGRVNAGTTVIVDGQVSTLLRAGDVIEVRCAKKRVRIMPHPGRSFFQTLSRKLHWGQSPHHS